MMVQNHMHDDAESERPDRVPIEGVSRPISTGLRAMQIGQEITVVRQIHGIELDAPSRLAKTIGGMAGRAIPGASFQYETFTAVTSLGRPIAGCVLKRIG